jgi:hypothetical protein
MPLMLCGHGGGKLTGDLGVTETCGTVLKDRMQAFFSASLWVSLCATLWHAVLRLAVLETFLCRCCGR